MITISSSKFFYSSLHIPSFYTAQYSNYTYQQQKPALTALPPGCNYELYRSSYEQAVRLKNEAAKPGISEFEKTELLRKAQWAEYYSSMAYYGKTFSQQQAQAQAALPPPLSVVTAAPTVTPPSPSINDNMTTGKSATTDKDYPESLQRYVNRIAEGFKTDSERKKAQEMVERVIANAVKNNALWTTDWDKLIVPNSSQTSSLSTNAIHLEDAAEKSKSSSDSCNLSAEDRLTNTTPSKKRKWRDISEAERPTKNPPCNTGYYGPTKSPKAPVGISSDEDEAESNGNYYGPTSPKQLVAKHSTFSNGLSSSKTRKLLVKANNPLKDSKKSVSSDVVMETRTTNIDFDVSLSRLDARANRFSDMNKQVGAKSSAASVVKPSAKKLFAQYMGEDVIGGGRKLDENDFERMTVKGTCQVLEKDYLRLTAPPQVMLKN
jgi:hypothetical protein